MTATLDLEPIRLSPLESTTNSLITDLSEVSLEKYREIAKIPESLNSPRFEARMSAMGLVDSVDGVLRPTGFGNILFGKDPRLTMPQVVLLGTIHFNDGTEEIKNFDGPQVMVPEQVIAWIAGKLPNVLNRTNGRRLDTGPIFELLRESIVNAIVHRDYSLEGAKIQLIVSSESIVVMSPGKPVSPITIEQLQSFSAPMLSRNPVLHRIFADMELAEERGLGLMSMKSKSETLGLPLPRFQWEDPYLKLTIFLTSSGRMSEINSDLLATLNSDEQAIFNYMSARETVSSPALADHFGFDERKVQRLVKKLIEAKLIAKSGKGKSIQYFVAN